MFPISNGIARKVLKAMSKKKKKQNKIALVLRRKLNSTENITSKALTDSEISNEEFTITINEADKYCKLK